MVDALAVLISNPYLLYKLSVSEKFLIGVISCVRCFSRSQTYSLNGIYTFYELKDIQWSKIL